MTEVVWGPLGMKTAASDSVCSSSAWATPQGTHSSLSKGPRHPLQACSSLLLCFRCGPAFPLPFPELHLFPFSLERFIYFYFVCMSVHISVYVCGACGGQRSLDPQELELQTVVGCEPPCGC